MAHSPSPRARIMGLGQWLPGSVRANEFWPPAFIEAAHRRRGDRTMVSVATDEHGDRLDRIVARHVASEAEDPFSGSLRRRIAPPGITTAEAELLAAQAALADAGVAAADLDMVVSWELVPEGISQPSAPRVAHALGAHSAFAVGMDALCSSAIVQLTYAAAMVESGRARHALLTQSHLITRAVSPMHPAAPTLGDLATAMVVGLGPGHELASTHAITHGEHADAFLWLRDGDTPWYAAGSRFDLGTKDRKSAHELMRTAARMGVRTVREALAAAGLEAHLEPAPGARGLAALISVQPRRWLPVAIAEALDLPPERAPETFTELGHVGGCAIVANLLAARERALLAPGDLVALYAQGAGFTRAAAVLRWQVAG